MKYKTPHERAMETYFHGFQKFRNRIDTISVGVFSKRDIQFLINQSLLRALDEDIPALEAPR